MEYATPVWVPHLRLHVLQWNLSNAVAYGPDIFGLIREVAAIQKTSINSHLNINEFGHIVKVVVKTTQHNYNVVHSNEKTKSN